MRLTREEATVNGAIQVLSYSLLAKGMPEASVNGYDMVIDVLYFILHLTY